MPCLHQHGSRCGRRLRQDQRLSLILYRSRQDATAAQRRGAVLARLVYISPGPARMTGTTLKGEACRWKVDARWSVHRRQTPGWTKSGSQNLLRRQHPGSSKHKWYTDQKIKKEKGEKYVSWICYGLSRMLVSPSLNRVQLGSTMVVGGPI